LISSNVILTPGKLAETVEYFLAEPEGILSFDMETSGEDRGVSFANSASWIGLATRGRSAVIPFGHPIGTKIVGQTKEARVQQDHKRGGTQTRMFRVPIYEPAPVQLDRAEVFEALRPLFFGSGKTLVGSGLQFDLATIAKYYGDEIPPGPHCDTIVLRWLIDENRKRYGLKYITKDIYGFSYDDEEVGKCVEKHPFNKVAHYLHCDVVYPLFEYRRLRPLIDELKLNRVYDLEMALLPVLARMRLTGMKVDRERLEQMREDLGVRVEQVEGRIYSAAGRKFNINAARQKQEVLYGPRSQGGQGLKPWKLTDGGKAKVEAGQRPDIYCYSTDADALDSYVGNPVVDALLDYQEWYKLLHTYVLGYLGDPTKKDKPSRIFDERIFADFVQYGTKTGRFSCREPNLQNVGRPDTELGKLIRGAFIAEPGRRLIVADYDQIELVVLAHFLGQGQLFEGFLQGIDPHKMTAAMVLGKDPADVTKDERQRFGKSINFAVVYGAGDGKVASMIGCPVKEARAFLEKHEMEFPEIYGFRDYILDDCRSQKPPHIRTLFGRMRRVPGIHSREKGMRLYSERQAFNSLIQGSSADIIKLAMVRLSGTMPCWMKLHLTVHDELVTSAPVDKVEEGRAILLNAMTGPGIGDLLRVPLKSDCAIVERWSDAK
jgi:DNA polymerase I-like protein with 3'-5' exonuclease and polymerase domains